MDDYILLTTIIGIAGILMTWMPAISDKTGISYSLFYMLAGFLLYYFFSGNLPSPLPGDNESLTLHLTELIVIISLMGTGIKIDRPFSFTNWSSPLRLVSVAMLICIATSTAVGFYLLDLDLPAAVLLGAVLAPTDPVLASDVQVGPPNEKVRFETKFALTSEAGMNDGMAFPFTWLAIVLAAMAAGEPASIGYWMSYHVIYQIAAGIAIGYVCGKGVGYLVFELAEKFSALKTRDGFLAISVTLMVYGLAESAHSYGFIATFVCASTLRHYEKGHHYHQDLHEFTDQIERLFVAVLLVGFGGTLAMGILTALTWQMVAFSVGFLLIVRPLAAWISLHGRRIHRKERLAISFFGIRGMGSIFYLAFAFKEMAFNSQDELWAMVALSIALSVVIHGLTATPIMRYLQRTVSEEI
nr:sodium:proton antiporter [uncultured Dyadobacter sp.]